MLRLLVDTSTWLELAKRRDGRRWIVALSVLIHEEEVELFVPAVVIEEYARNREHVEATMTTNIAQRFKQIKQDLREYGNDKNDVRTIEDLARHVPLIGAMTTRNFNEVFELLEAGQELTSTPAIESAIVSRGLQKLAPFHRSRNSVADALIIELYAAVLADADLGTDSYAFVTSNSQDFSSVDGDKRNPHPDLAAFFVAERSTYGLGVEGLNAILMDHFGAEIEELFEETYFEEEPRRLDEIQAAEQEFSDRVWYHHSLQYEYQLERDGNDAELERLLKVAAQGRDRVEVAYPDPGQLGPYTDFELGMLNGKLSALRWVLGSEWDFLDT